MAAVDPKSKIWKRTLGRNQSPPDWFWESGTVLHAREAGDILEGWLCVQPRIVLVDSATQLRVFTKEFWFGIWSALIYEKTERGPSLEEIEAMVPLQG